jgi:hypothetical protein
MSGYPYPQPSGLPTVQGLYDVLRSGHRNLEPDRESADAITAVYPDIGGCLRKEHGFASRAVTLAAQRGVGQYIVAAAGMPAPQGLNVHEIARRVLPAARAVYTGSDPYAITYTAALLAEGDPGVAAVNGDFWSPRPWLKDPALTGLLDFGRPVCVVARMIMHFIPPGEAANVIAELTEPLAAGSRLVVSAWLPPPAELARLLASVGAVYEPTPDDMSTWLKGAGLELEPPGIVGVRAWPLATRPGGHVAGAVAVKR